MARRQKNRELDIALGIAQLVALLVLGGVFVPPLRQMLLGLGLLVVGGVVLAGAVALGMLLIRRSAAHTGRRT